MAVLVCVYAYATCSPVVVAFVHVGLYDLSGGLSKSFCFDRCLKEGLK